MNIRGRYQPAEMWHSTPSKKGHNRRYDRGECTRDLDYAEKRYPQMPESPPYSMYSQITPPRYMDHPCHSSGTSLRRGLANTQTAHRQIQFHNHGGHAHTQSRLPRSKVMNDSGRGHRSNHSVQFRYKTELCRAYEDGRNCPFGKDCTFAHGFVELRAVSHHPKYKTDLCRPFHTMGYCFYGTRCHFVHNPDEMGGMSPTGGYLIRKRQMELLSQIAQAEANGSKPVINEALLINLMQLVNSYCGEAPCPSETLPLHCAANSNLHAPSTHTTSIPVNPQSFAINQEKATAAILQQLNHMTLMAFQSPKCDTKCSASESLDPVMEASSLDGSYNNSLSKGSSETSTWSCSSTISSPSKESLWDTKTPAACPPPPSSSSPSPKGNFSKEFHPLQYHDGFDLDGETAALLSTAVAESVIENSN